MAHANDVLNPMAAIVAAYAGNPSNPSTPDSIRRLFSDLMDDGVNKLGGANSAPAQIETRPARTVRAAPAQIESQGTAGDAAPAAETNTTQVAAPAPVLSAAAAASLEGSTVTAASSEVVSAALAEGRQIWAGATDEQILKYQGLIKEHELAVDAKGFPIPTEVGGALIDGMFVKNPLTGKRYKMMKKNLALAHSLVPEELRAMFGPNLPVDFPVVGPAYSESKRDQAATQGLGRNMNKVVKETATTDAVAEAPKRRGRKPKQIAA